MWKRKKKKKVSMEHEMFIAVSLIAAKDRKKKFFESADWLLERGLITREELPEILDKICKMEGNAGEIGRAIREELRREGWPS